MTENIKCGTYIGTVQKAIYVVAHQPLQQPYKFGTIISTFKTQYKETDGITCQGHIAMKWQVWGLIPGRFSDSRICALKGG